MARVTLVEDHLDIKNHSRRRLAPSPFSCLALATGNYRYYLKDHLGSIRATVEEDGSVADFYDYYPFGFTLRAQNSAQGSRFKFSEKELDGEAGIDWFYFGARYYDAGIGRWLSVDPLGNNRSYLTPYHYCSNNPISRIDFDGNIDWALKGIKAVNKKDYKNGAWGLKNTVVRTSTYQDTNRPKGATNPHIGIDYRASEGTDFYSLGDGTVIASGKTSKDAKYLTVEYEGGDKLRFLHIDEVAEGLELGEEV